MTPNCAGHLAIHHDLCASSCARYSHTGDRAARVVRLNFKKPVAECLDYLPEPGAVADYMKDLPF